MALAIHCDKDDCDTWSFDNNQFIIVAHPGPKIRYYCTRWCMVVEESKDVEPTEIV